MSLLLRVKALAEAVGADIKALANGKVNSNDPRLSDSREWSEATVPQAEAEAGTASTRRAWTAQRVRQAINAWWQLVTSGFGRNFIAATNEQAARNVLGLGNVDNTKDADKRVGSFAIHDTRSVVSVPDNVPARAGLFEFKSLASVGSPPKPASWAYAHVLTTNGWTADGTGGWPTQVSLGDALSFRKGTGVTTWGPWYELISTATTLGATGQSTLYPMTQKAVTDAINARGFADASGVLTATSGALSNDMSSFLSQTTKATMRSNLEVPQLNASATAQGGLKARLDGTTLYLSNNGTNP